MPAVERPEGHQPFQQKLLWTLGVLGLYFFLTNILVFGLAEGRTGTDVFGQFRSILAGSQGSILQLGIGPIVTGSIVLQLLTGAGVVDLDKNDPREQMLYQGLQKLLVSLMVVITAIPMVFTGFLPASTQLGQALGIGTTGVQALMFTQIVLGGLLIFLMDEIVSKWGIGSGVGLFIIAGISQRLIGGVFTQLFADWYKILTNGLGYSLLSTDGIYALLVGQGHIVALATTLFIFGVVVFFESTRIEVPLSHAKAKGHRGKFPIKLIYASVLPMILVRAVQMNIQFFGRILNKVLGSDLPAAIGVYASSQPVDGLFYYLAPIYSPEQWMWWTGGTTAEWWQVMLRLSVDLTFMVIGGAIFAVFWVETTGMGSKETAKQIHNSGMQIPGFRRNPQIVERVLARYIPAVTMLGGAIVGLLAVLANLLGTIGGVSGTGLLLAVSITYKLSEQVGREKAKDLFPMARKLFS